MIGRFLRLFCALALLVAAPAPSLGQMQFSNPSTTTTTPYASGSYYIPEGTFTAIAGSASAAGVIRLMPGYIRQKVTVSSLSVKVTTLSSGGLFQIAVYAADPVTNMPTGAPVYTSASQSTTTATIVEVTGLSLNLSRGLYWFCVQADATGASAAFTSVTATSMVELQLVGVSSTTNLLSATTNATGMNKTGTFGTWPTLTGNATTDSLNQITSSTQALVAFKAA